MIYIYDLEGDVLGKSKNLAGINRRCEKVPGAKAWVYSTEDGKTAVDVSWPDGSYAVVPFFTAKLAYKYANTQRFQP